MVVEYIRYKIGAERADAFLAAYRAAEPSLRGSPACLGYELTRCTEAPESFILRIEWQSVEAHLEGFRKSPGFQGFLQAVRPYLGDIEEMRHYDATGIGWKR
jgi:quinol monooxygenase YgiN